jgi:hypothetical protein
LGEGGGAAGHIISSCEQLAARLFLATVLSRQFSFVSDSGLIEGARVIFLRFDADQFNFLPMTLS